MSVLNSEEIRALAPMQWLVECLQKSFRTECIVPVRQVAQMPDGTDERLHLSIPAFDPKGGRGVKLATVFPDNQANRLPPIQAAIVSCSISSSGRGCGTR